MDNIRKIPVFVYPNSIKFYLSSRVTHKQLIALYNPYDFPVRFKVMCTAPNKYSVIDPEGSIAPHSSVDIVIRHNFPVAAHCNVVDKFRITMQDHATRQPLGKKDIEATLLTTERESTQSEAGDNFHSLPFDRSSEDQRSMQYPISTRRSLSAQSNNLIAIVAGLICIFALLLPTRHDKESEQTIVPTYLHLSVNLKLVFAYVLGLVSMVVFRP